MRNMVGMQDRTEPLLEKLSLLYLIDLDSILELIRFPVRPPDPYLLQRLL